QEVGGGSAGLRRTGGRAVGRSGGRGVSLDGKIETLRQHPLAERFSLPTYRLTDLPTYRPTSSRGGTRTPDPVINSHLLYQLSYSGSYRGSKVVACAGPGH